MAFGDHIKVSRGFYSHHGIDVGDGTVIHFTGEPGRKDNAEIRRTSLDGFLCEGNLEVVEYGLCYPFEYTVKLAFQSLGQKGYNLFAANCEHFARYCKTGESKSQQVASVTTTIGSTTMQVGSTHLGLGVVSSAGCVAGLSGSGLMTGLKAIGPGGPVGGLLTLAAAPAVLTNMAVNKMLEDDPSLSEQERTARSFARTGTKIGTVAGAIGAVNAVSASGTVIGLSGAGITSGLAAIGETVGGGMVAGAAATIAAPAVFALGLGLLLYSLLKP